MNGVSNSARHRLDFGPLRRVGNGMKGGAEREAAFIAAGVDVDHHPHLRENARLDEIRDAIGDGAAGIARETRGSC